MAKHVFIPLFFFIFMNFTTAQLTLQQVNGSKKHVIPIGNLISLSFPMKTKGLAEEAAQTYTGTLKNVSKTSIDMVLTYENRQFVNEYGVKIQEKKETHALDSPTIVQMPVVKLQYVTQYFKKNRKISNTGVAVLGLAILSNLFITPHLKAPYNKTVRNGGYIVMGVALTTALIPTQKKYYLEQPANGNETLWQLKY
jgi:hypothetical protein